MSALSTPVDPDDPLVVYYNTIDQGSFAMQVIRNPEGMADYRVWDVRGEQPVLLHEERTALIGGAIFGPDADDITRWQTTALWHIDARLEGHPNA